MWLVVVDVDTSWTRRLDGRNVRSPKLVNGSASDRYYTYYAGYTFGFVEDVLNWLEVDGTTCLADPWNGSGTTTLAAAARGVRAVGFNLNPAAVLIGRSRLLSGDAAGRLVPLGVQIVPTFPVSSSRD